MAMAAAVTLASPRLFSQLSRDYLVKNNCECHREALSVVLFAFTHKSSIVRQGVSARAFLGVSSYVLHTREKIRFLGSFLSSSNLFTFLAPWAGNYSLRSGVGYSLCSVVVRAPRACLFSPLKISPEAGGLRLVLPIIAECGHRKCHKGHCQQVCGALRRWSL